MYLGAVATEFMPSTGYTQAQIDDWITRTAAQPADAFLMGAARTVGEFWERSGFTRADLEKLALQGLEQEALFAWAQSQPAPTGGTAPRPIVPTTAIAAPASREAVIAAFRNTPGANPQPDDAAISYYMGKGIAQMLTDVAAIRKSNPALAAQIDAKRKAMGLPTAGGATTPITPITPVTTPTSGTGGAGGMTALLLAAAAAYFIGS